MARLVTLVFVLLVFISAVQCSQDGHCGERMLRHRALLVGGKDSQRGMWPWQVGIYKNSVSGWNFLCGGALVAPQWVLTAAHCFFVKRKNSHRIWSEKDIQPVSKYKIRAGDHELSSYESSEQEHTPQEIHLFPGYRHDPIYENDIALVKLNQAATLGPYVRTVCLPDVNVELANPGSVGMVAGWGITESGSGSSFLLHSSFKIEKDDVCDRTISFYYNKTVTFCASDLKGNSAPCYGDSGGNMVRKLLLNGHFRWVTVGVVSWGGCVLRNHFGYYTRLQPFIPWIFHKVNSTCMDLGQPTNGVSTSAKSIYHPNDMVRFTCKTSYTTLGNSQLTCQRDGNWNGHMPLCLAPCPYPVPPKNGIRIGNNFKHGHSVWFKCNRDHKLVGSSILTCTNGKWGSSVPRCAAACLDPGTPIDGHRYNHSFHHGDKVMFSCQKGKKLIGEKIITCADGQWDYKAPLCDALCSNPTNVPNARKRVFMFKVEYQCYGGYKVFGSSQINCIRGVWDGEPPRCLRGCAAPKPFANGRINGGDFVDHGQSIRFICNNGFQRNGPKQLRCNNGRWNKNIPTCVGVCSRLSAPKNGEIVGSNFFYGATVMFRCDNGYSLRGPKNLTCVKGEWTSVNKVPVCKEDCKDPGVPVNGRRHGNIFVHGNDVTFTCNNGLALFGPSTIRCKNGKWSDNKSSCKGKKRLHL